MQDEVYVVQPSITPFTSATLQSNPSAQRFPQDHCIRAIAALRAALGDEGQVRPSGT